MRSTGNGIPLFVNLQRRIVKHKASILAAIEHGLSNGRIESVNTKIRLITQIAFGSRSPEALIALAMLTLGGHPTLPGADDPRISQKSTISTRLPQPNLCAWSGQSREEAATTA